MLDGYTSQYAQSSPYKHCVISDLISDRLLRNVKAEVDANIVFTCKETDIYRIYQSGDLANLDGLDDESLAKLPSLLKLRDALYSQSFRDYVSSITSCGPLSGRKRDLAINTYRPGSYLICHDDAIGTRKVSYILYLVDPDKPWKPEWGGALRLFPVRELEGKDGQVACTPKPDHCKSIPPAWNQLSLFEVVPNKSFHDVQEVYRAETKEQLEKDGGRVRMAVSGWFHIPQPGEDGFIQGAAEQLEKNSGLAQLQGNPNQYDMPQANVMAALGLDDAGFTVTDLDFLVKYLAPQWLTPEAVSGILDRSVMDSCIVLPDFLRANVAQKLFDYVTQQESVPLPESSEEIEMGGWKVAKPPHKHRYLFLQTGAVGRNESLVERSPITKIMDDLLPSPAFRKWLGMITGTNVKSYDILARRFRRGMDYRLATGYEGKSRLEINLGLTPTSGWKNDGLDEGDEETSASELDGDEPRDADDGGGIRKSNNGEKQAIAKPGALNSNGTVTDDSNERVHEIFEEGVEACEDDDDGDVGGQEIYMAEDDNGGDAAVYKTVDEEESILFWQGAAFNRLSIVLRDSGILQFVKYVSRSAQGDRWDISATCEVDADDNEDEGSGDEEEQHEKPEDDSQGLSDGD